MISVPRCPFYLQDTLPLLKLNYSYAFTQGFCSVAMGCGASILATTTPRRALNKPGRWDVFISHTQRNPNAKLLASELYHSLKEKGLSVWLDVKMDDMGEAAMREGVENAALCLAIVTDGAGDPNNAYFSRTYCVQELRWAVEAGVPIQPMIDIDDKKRIGEFIKGAPPDLRFMGDIQFLELYRGNPKMWDACVTSVVHARKKADKRRGAEMQRRRDAEKLRPEGRLEKVPMEDGYKAVKQAKSAGDVGALVAAMRRHVDEAGVQEKACEVITEFSEADRMKCEVKRRIFDAGGIECVVAAMLKHPDDADLQLKAIKAIHNVSITNDGSLEFIWSRRIANAGALESIMSAMRRHPDDAELNCRALTTLEFQLWIFYSTGAKPKKELVKRVADADGVKLVEAVMARPWLASYVHRDSAKSSASAVLEALRA